jgi:hypothetical protein
VVNPTHGLDARGGEEPALAARAYGRSGALDAYGFARAGRRTGAGVGAALAWVADEAMELHASARWANAVDTTAPDAALVDARTGLAARDPWAPATVRHVAQVLAGGTWTNAAQLSLLAEAWWDGAARSGAQWEAWRTRNATLVAERHAPVPPAAVAGNLGWQARAVGDTTSVRRANLFARASWTSGPWQPALDVLLTPEDRGHVLTASLGWQGDRTRVDAGWRHYGGAPDAIYALLPTRRLGYVAATWTF